jgi:hypothetical protein
MGVVATADDAGNPEAALMDLLATSSGEVIFDTRADAQGGQHRGQSACRPRHRLE